MKKIIFTIFILVFLNSMCFAVSEEVTVLLNKGITISYGTDEHENNSYTLYDEGYFETNVLAKFEYKDYRFYAASLGDDNEYFHYKNEVFPISYEGTTYLPIRSISGLLRMGITWDGETKTIKIGEGNSDWRAIGTDEKMSIEESQTITVLRNEDIKIYYNGELQTFKDANGKVVYPLSYNGTTYLPIRACANLYDLIIDWNGNTNTVTLTRKSSRKVFTDNSYDKIALSHYTDEELEIILNEFFARYGHDFDTQRLEDYFSMKSWYKKIDGKKVATTELDSREQRIVEDIKKEVELRKSYKDINTVTLPEMKNNENLKMAEILRDDKGNNYYVKIFDNTTDAINVTENNSQISKIELLPSKIYTMNEKAKYYYKYNGEVYYIPAEKVSSKAEEKIVLRDEDIVIYNNGDIQIVNIKDPNFFNVDAFIDTTDSDIPEDLIDFLLSKVPAEPKTIGFKYNFDNNLNTSEYIITIAENEFESGANYLTTGKKFVYVYDGKNGYNITRVDDVDIDKNIAGYSNLFVKKANWLHIFDDDLNEDYSVRHYVASMVSRYIKENFIDAYYVFVPEVGFRLVNKTLDGEEIDIEKYVFTLSEDLYLYNAEHYKNEYGLLEGYTDTDEHKFEDDAHYYYLINEPDDFIGEDAVKISEGSKVKIAYAEGWWHVILESEDGKEVYVIHYTPAGVT